MDTKKLDAWADLLLDTGKRNNLVNFKDTKTSTIEIILPSADDLFTKVESSSSFEVFDPKISYDDGDEESDEEKEESARKVRFIKEDYLAKYGSKIKKSQVLLFNSEGNPFKALKNIDKKAREYLEETGVNVVYIAFGFVKWKESEQSNIEYLAPIILAPISLENDSAINPWHIIMSEDDVVINPTFSFKLDNDYGIKLPEYTDENLSEYLNKVNVIVSKLGWEVINDCKIGIFSFLKLNMYRDLKDNQDAILSNPNVRLLMGEPVKSKSMPIGEEGHRVNNPLIELHNVVDADSSQIEAIQKAISGESFVLQGPPGTGKSQTITNIIAECIFEGKKVLFVSEKQAALNVVYDKLKKNGLEEFCLELHSHKSNKKVVIDELGRTLKLAKTRVSSRAEGIIESKEKSQIELDKYEEELHSKRDVIGCSLYQLYEKLSSYRNVPEIRYSVKNINGKGNDYLKTACDLLGQYVEHSPSVGYEYKKNAWFGYNNVDTSFEVRESIKNALIKSTEVFSELSSIQSYVEDKYGIDDLDNYNKALVWKEIFRLICDNDIITVDFLSSAKCSYLCSQLVELGRIGKEIKSIRQEIDSEYDAEVYQFDSRNIEKKLTRQFTGGFSRLFNSEYKKIISDIRLNKKDGKKPSYENAVKLFEKLNLVKEKSEEFAKIENPIKKAFGDSYKGVDSDWDAIVKPVQSLNNLLPSGVSFGKLQKVSKDEFTENIQDFSIIIDRIEQAEETFKPFKSLLESSYDKNVIDFEANIFNKIIKKLGSCLKEFDKLENWSVFYSLLIKLQEQDLTSFVETAIKENVPLDVFVDTYKHSFYNQWIDYVLHSSKFLMSFDRVRHDKSVENFSNQDEQQFSISRVQIKEEISKNRPPVDIVAAGGAVSTLLREVEKKRKQKSIRMLMEDVGELVQILKPCFLMSPLSVSTFLNTNKIHFDVVVFDEASQIFPQDAIGAIYRANQLIVVGDSKQMPPTNFFNATVDYSDSDEETGDVHDFESILDLCSATFPQLRLKWHYRSRYEQLISFSNANFYDNDLVTFPSSIVDKKGVGVDYYYVNGIFDHKSRNNRKEAEFIVDLIYDNIEKYPNRSLGVVAFSVSQQDLIERLLSKRRIEKPDKEAFFSKAVAEPFFIKNLETVQGDERDTIIFSVAYGKDSQGRLMHNFGPLNRDGGERRLNVAVTRAKMNVQLVSSMHCTDIDLSRTNSLGARRLREYLDYAENGEIALERAISVNPFEQFDSEFELEVCEFLREKGFEVDTQVGCSSFKIDLGLKRPGTSDYVLAIECDGATYHSSKNARDRDRLRQQILEGMGWKFYRIWSTDWFRNKSVEKERLIEAAQKAINSNHSFEKKGGNTQSDDSLFGQDSAYELKVFEDEFKFSRYKIADVELYSTENISFQYLIKRVLITEAPLSEEWLLKRIPWLFGREKATSYVQKEYEQRMYGCEKNGIIRRNGFLYLNDRNEFSLRVPYEGDEHKRDVKYISLEELASGMSEVIKHNVTVDKNGLYKFLTNQLGFQRVTDNMIARYDEALGYVKNLVIDGDNLSINDD